MSTSSPKFVLIIGSLACLVVGVACGASAPTQTTTSPLPTAPTSPARSAWDTAVLARSNATAPAPTSGLAIIVSQTDISLGEGRAILPLPPRVEQARGVDAAYKHSGPNDLFIVPLAKAVAGAHEVRLAVDPLVPYRLLVEVLFTLEQSEVTTHLIVRSGDANATIDPLPHRPETTHDAAHPLSGLAVLIVSDGISLKARGGNIQAGCTSVGVGLAVPKKNGEHDFAEVARCARVVKMISAEFASETRVTIVANASADFQSIVSTIDALRPEFPDVTFGIAE